MVVAFASVWFITLVQKRVWTEMKRNGVVGRFAVERFVEAEGGEGGVA